MSHTPYGYRIINGKAVVDKQAAKQIKTLFQSYLSGDSLATAAKKANIKAFHAGISRMLQNKRYIGDEYYPAIIDLDEYVAVQAERIRRAEKLGRIHEAEKQKDVVYPSTFHFIEGTERFDDPFQQAEYSYSLIESEGQ
jgi:hypothetical protein